MLSYDQALQVVIDSIAPLPARQLPLGQAAGLILAGPARARWDMPRWDNSAMDGFALTASADERYTLVGAAYAGQPHAGRLQAGEAIAITTGAPLPEGADTVVPLEDCAAEVGQLFLRKPVRPGQHVRYRGEEYRADALLLPAGTKLTAGAIGLLASAGPSAPRYRRRSW